METTFLLGSNVMAPNLHAAMHHPHPMHPFSSTCIVPFSLFLRAFVGHDGTHGALSQRTQATAMLPRGSRLTTRMREDWGLPLFSLSAEQANSQI
jgi:hypothetical protein